MSFCAGAHKGTPAHPRLCRPGRAKDREVPARPEAPATCHRGPETPTDATGLRTQSRPSVERCWLRLHYGNRRPARLAPRHASIPSRTGQGWHTSAEVPRSAPRLRDSPARSRSGVIRRVARSRSCRHWHHCQRVRALHSGAGRPDGRSNGGHFGHGKGGAANPVRDR
jgi:hypothetical protein